MDIDKITNKVKENDPKADTDLIVSAYHFGKKAHEGQYRKTGEPYFDHSLHTAYTLAQIKADPTTVAAGLLHDVPEDTSVTLKKIKEEFGEEVAHLVRGITKLGKVRYRGEERYVRNLKKMFLAMANDLRVILIKFADRLHNLETLYVQPQHKQQRIAQEVLEIYVPIAWLLGVWELKWQMEDWCFKYLYPEEYKNIKHTFENKEVPKIKDHIQETKKILKKELQQANINYECKEFYKHFYSIYRKTQDQQLDIEDIHDTFSIIIITDSVPECYRILGTIHSLWRPKDDLFKDFIALPKPNGYRSIHTTVFGPRRGLTEFQIKTRRMYEESLYGISAYWHHQRFSEDGEKAGPPKWVQEISEVQKNAQNNYDFVDQIKYSVLKDRILVFTPKGDIIRLVKDASPIDFAYHIHTDVGNKAHEAVVNSQKVPFDTKLKNGDSVEIITKKSKKYPNPKWLKFIKTHKAQTKIKENLPESTLKKFKNFLTPKKDKAE